MKLRIASLLLAGLILVFFCGCEFMTGGGNDNTEGTEATDNQGVEYVGYDAVDRELFEYKSPEYAPVTLRKGYNSLETEAMKECYNRIDESVYYISQTMDAVRRVYDTLQFTLEGVTLTEAELRVVISAYFGDNPQVYWVDNNFEYASTKEKTVLQLFSFMSGAEVEATARMLQNSVNNTVLSMESGLDEYDRELYIHDAVVGSCDYADGVVSINDNYRAFTCYGALVEKEAVCEGYSRGFQLLLSRVGIESYCTLGVGDSDLHMWNCVKLGEDWYYVDTTWDEDDESGVCYDYFNLSTEEFERNHYTNPLFSELTVEEICGDSDNPPKSFNIFAPVCTDDSMDYYQQSGVVVNGISSDNDDRICAAIIDAVSSAESDEITLFIYIDQSSIDYGYAVSNLFYDGEYMIFDCIDAVNEQGTVQKIDRNDVSIRQVRELSGVNVYLTLE